ncbi:MAG: hypothetical protein EOO40_10850 [Deltaproteobacteria bacterium]|nr:MAG: hypothetical protein EOO40_10850 [Deltaproteobacteria bacterium]
MGRAAVKALLLVLPLLGGCTVVSDIAGLAAGGAAGSATANPVVGYAVGIGVRAGVDELRRYVVRRRQQGEQDAIATAAGEAPLGQSRAWAIRHSIPIGNEQGTLTVVREISTPLTTCREILFSVDKDVFTTPVCRQPTGWKWAAAEPAVDRWGSLQ